MRYHVISQNLWPEEIAAAILAVQGNHRYGLDDLSHVFDKVANRRVGYIGDDTLELCTDDSFCTLPHAEIEDLLVSALN